MKRMFEVIKANKSWVWAIALSPKPELTFFTLIDLCNFIKLHDGLLVQGMSEISAPYRVVQPPKWTRKHSFGLLYFIIFLVATFTPMSLVNVDGVGFSGVVRIHGFPLNWLAIRSFEPFWVIISWLGMILDLCLYAALCIVIVYPRRLIRIVRRTVRP